MHTQHGSSVQVGMAAPGSAYWDEDDLTSLSTEFDNSQPPTPELREELWELIDQARGFKAIEHFLLEISFEQYDPVKLLMDTNATGQTFLHHAAIRGDVAAVQVLESQVVFPTRHPPMPKYRVVLRHHLLLQQDEDGNTHLHVAAAHGHLRFIQALIKFHEGRDITQPIEVDEEQVDVDKRTYTYINIRNIAGRTAWEEALQAGSADVGEWLKRYW